MLNINPLVRLLIECYLLLAAAAAWGGDPNLPTQLEMVQLPTFCWGHYNKSLKGPEYNIQGCGWGMSHYCDALVDLKRSEAPGLQRSAQIRYLQTAKHRTEYALDHMRGSPGCPIRRHIETTLIKVNARLVGVK